jgi:hypothetical protein
MLNSISNIKGISRIEGVWEQGAEENIWSQEGEFDRRVERKLHNGGLQIKWYIKWRQQESKLWK